MKKTFEDSVTTVWENNKGEKIVAMTATSYKGRYWSVDFIRKPGDFEKLGTRCTWDKVLAFVAEHE